MVVGWWLHNSILNCQVLKLWLDASVFELSQEGLGCVCGLTGLLENRELALPWLLPALQWYSTRVKFEGSFA